MNTENKEDIEQPAQVLPSDTNKEETTDNTEVTFEQDPLKTELEKVQSKKRTKTEKLIYTKQRVEEQLKELGIDEDEPSDEDDKPVTLGMLKKLQAQSATKTAIQLANEVSNETERELLKYHLENTIKSTGNAQEDLKLAQNQVYAVKNQQIIEEMNRKTPASSHSSSPGAPAKIQKSQDDLTPEELSFMRPPFNLTKEQVIAARPK